MKVEFEVNSGEKGELSFQIGGIIYLPDINGTPLENSMRYGRAEARAQAILSILEGETRITRIGY